MIGPTAIPAFWREHYNGLQNFRLGEMLPIVGHQLKLFVTNRDRFRHLAWQELGKQSRREWFAKPAA